MEALNPDVRMAHPFNSPLETGMRAVIVLEAFHPRPFGLTEMTWLDHLVVHTADLDGQDVPSSLHPDLPNSTGELLVRRQLVERSLRMMQQMHLVEVNENERGVFYSASEDSPSYVDSLRSDYSTALKARAKWLAQRFSKLSTAEIKGVVEARIGRWTAEFRIDQASSGLARP